MTLDAAIEKAISILGMKPNCTTCGMGVGCLGCPEETEFRKQRNALFEELKKDKLDGDTVMELADAIRYEERLKLDIEVAQGHIKSLYAKLKPDDSEPTDFFANKVKVTRVPSKSSQHQK